MEQSYIRTGKKKAAPLLYYLRQLKRSWIAPKEMLLFYITCISPTLEYACSVFHRALPEYLNDDLERVQWRALRIIFPDLSYSQALETCGVQSLRERREMLTTKLFNNIVKDPHHKLHKLLPERSTLYLPTLSELKVWDFYPGTAGIFRRRHEHFRRFPKTSENFRRRWKSSKDEIIKKML